ncbi:MAG: hypothetical protein V4666_09150 [Bacteroidota bacterium]
MKKGLISTFIFYVICMFIFIALSKYTYQPAHFFGANYLFLFLLFFMSIVGVMFHLAKIANKKNTEFNIGALIIHSSYVIGMILWYLIGYYSQFE